MSTIHPTNKDAAIQNERLARAFFVNGRFIPHFLAVTGIGLISIYILARFEIFGQPSPPLIYIGASTLILALIHIPLLELARRNKGIAATLWSTLANGIFAIVLTLFWQGIYPVSILIVLLAPLLAVRTGLSRRNLIFLLGIALLSIAGILYTENQTVLNRLQIGTPVSLASFAFLMATGSLLAIISVISENRNFKKLQNLLLVSFAVLVTVPTLMAAALSAIGTYTNSQTQTFNTLQAVTSLKVSQLDVLIEGFHNDAVNLQGEAGFSKHALDVLSTRGTDTASLDTSKRLGRDFMEALLPQQYTEVMVLNTQGEVMISTLPENEGVSLENQLFFRQGTLRFFTGFSDLASFGEANFIIATPLFDVDGRIIRGVLALRSDAAPIRKLMENTPGFEDAETYLVDREYRPITKTRTPTSLINTRASLEAILNNITDGQAIYDNYEKQQVLGYYTWFEPMQVAVISEVPLDTVVGNSARALLGSAVLAVFVISMAIAAVAISSNSIVHPIKVLAQTSENFAAGKLSARAPIERKDEIGALANSYNQMASQLQEIIGRLEQRVNDRTRDLESQTRRLRMAAEIARDAAAARSLSGLLERSAQLISSRFDFHHSGIFLIDQNREYAVLVASSSEAGRQMMMENQWPRVGDFGVVGRAAASGEPRIVLATDPETTFFGHEKLPSTLSELVLPLRAENSIIGILDLHSDQPQAFDEDDIAIMQTLADQLATAIERMRLLQEVESSLNELESAYGRYTREGWTSLFASSRAGLKGYRFDNIEMERLSELRDIEKEVLETGTTASLSAQQAAGHGQSTVAIPIKLRGQTIGVISVKLREEHTENTVSTIELASDRLASALESARLYEEARLRADREQSISQVATAISASTSYEDILQTTIKEIGSTLKDAEVSIQILDQSNS